MLLRKVEQIVNKKFSDHNLLIATLGVETVNENKDIDQIQYKTYIPRYNWKCAGMQEWSKFCDSMNSMIWEEITEEIYCNDMEKKLEKLYNLLEEKVVENFDDNLEKIKSKKGPKNVKKLFSMKAKLSK